MVQEPFVIVYEDEFIVVLNKIAKILTVPTVKKEKYTLTSLLRDHLKHGVYPCHRLDRETTGLMVFAKSVQMQDKVMSQFKQGTVKKRYIAFVRGSIKKQGVLEGEIIDQEGARHGEQKKYAKSLFKVIGRGEGFSAVDLIPMTGRTNQLRIQLAQAGHPILGEDKYAFRRDFEVNFKRLALHAYCLNFKHPSTGKHLDFSVDLPQDMEDFVHGR